MGSSGRSGKWWAGGRAEGGGGFWMAVGVWRGHRISPPTKHTKKWLTSSDLVMASVGAYCVPSLEVNEIGWGVGWLVVVGDV